MVNTSYKSKGGAFLDVKEKQI